MGVCVFKTEEIKRCVQHALKSNDWRMGWSDEAPQPAILFVHDQGVYCMSNGKPADIVEGDSAFCAFAEGCDPKKNEDWWEESRFLVGGDDFGETILVNDEFLNSCELYSVMEIHLTETQMEVIFAQPRKKFKKAV